MRKIKGYYFITGSALSKAGDAADVRQAVRSGVSVVQYRDKSADFLRMYETALELRRICKNTVFLVNNKILIALAVKADGVHLGQDDAPLEVARKILGGKKIIGVSVSTIAQARSAVKAGADYLGVGPVYATSTKLDAQKPIGVGLIRKIKKEFNIPVVAIGGITLKNAPQVIAAGADSVCAISSVVTKPDVVGQIRAFQSLFDK